MSYRARRGVADLFDAGPLELAARRIAVRCRAALLEKARDNSPVAEAPDGASRGEWLRSRGGRRPGSLRDSWEEGELEVVSFQRIRVTVLTRDAVAAHQEYGTRPHRIVARRARALRFWSGGAVVFRESVEHPGTRPLWMMHRAVEELRVEFRVIAQGELLRWSREQVAA